MNFYIMTLFPGQVDAFLGESIIGRARENGKINIKCINIRDFSVDKYGHVDDTPYGGGRGMVIRPEPVYNCYRSIVSSLPQKPYTVYMSPAGKTFTQNKAFELSEKNDIIIICGHYEGIDRRVIDEICDEEISIGNYILTGGEIAACVVADSVARLCEGVLPEEECYLNESHTYGVLEPPQYSGPRVFHEKSVPDILFSGDHKKIELWKAEKSLEETIAKRDDLI